MVQMARHGYLLANTRQQAFVDYLQRVGEGIERVYPSVGEDSILIPHDMCYNGPTVADLIEEVYGVLSSIVEYAARSTYIIEHAILTPLNEDVDAFNKLINDKYAFTKHDGSPAQHRVYYSADSVVHGEQHGIYPTEFLNTLNFSGVLPHELHLQEGCCRNPTLAKCGGEAQHLEKVGIGVLRDSRKFRRRFGRPKHLALGCSWCHWKGLKT